MKTKIWDLRNHATEDANVDAFNEIKNIFEAGGLIAIPTETVYGLGGDARNEQTIKIFLLQKVDLLIIHLSCIYIMLSN